MVGAMNGGAELDPDVDIEERLRTVCGHLNVLHAQLVELAAEALDTGSWQGWGVRSLSHWLTWQAGLSPGSAREVTRLAEARTSHPAIMSTFAAGAISMDQAAVATKAPAYLDEHLAQTVPYATVAQLRTMVRGTRSAPPAPDNPDLAPSESLVGMVRRRRAVPPARRARPGPWPVVDSALSEARDTLFQAGQSKVTWADALVEMAQRSLDGVPADERRERFRANWFIDPAEPIPARWTDGLAVPDWLRDLLTCDGTIAPVFTDGALPVSVGHTQLAIPDRTRRLVLARDRKCRVPWCSQTRWLQVHHIVHREDGGANDSCNLTALCPADHRLHHLGQLGISGNADEPDGLTFTDAKGAVVDPASRPIPPTGRPPGPAKPLRAPDRRTAPTLGGGVPRPTAAAPTRSTRRDESPGRRRLLRPRTTAAPNRWPGCRLRRSRGPLTLTAATTVRRRRSPVR